MKKSNNQKIKCDVESCDYQNCGDCTLDEIQVDCNCKREEATESKETACKSFRCECKKKEEK